MIIHTHDLPPDAGEEQIRQGVEYVRAHVAAVADADDDPRTRAEDVRVDITERTEEHIRIVGTLDAEPDAPYLREDFDPFAGVPRSLLAQVRDDRPGGST